MYFNVNFNVFFKLKEVNLLVSDLYIYQNARCNDNKKNYLQNWSQAPFILGRTKGVLVIIYIGVYVKYPSFLSDCNDTCICLTDFRRILRYRISWKSVNWGLRYSMRMDEQGDRRTDMT